MSLDALDHTPPYHGRKEDQEYLLGVVQAILKKSHSDVGNETCCSTVVSDSTSPTISTTTTGEEVVSSSGRSGSYGGVSPYKGKSISSDSRLIVISGPSGCGKSSLAREVLRRYTESFRCSTFLQVSGQFREMSDPAKQGDDKKKKNNPYARNHELENEFTAFKDIMKELIDFIIQDVELTHALLEKLKHSLTDMGDVAVLTQIFPCVKKLLHLEPRFMPRSNDDASPPNLYCCVHLHGTPSASERSPVVRRVITTLFHAVSLCLPLVLVLEDVQYADAESLVLIESLMRYPTMKNVPESSEVPPRSKGIFIIATYETDVGAPSTSRDALLALLQPEKDTTGALKLPIGLYRNESLQHIHHVSLSNLTREDVSTWVDAYCTRSGLVSRCYPGQKEAVSDMAFQQSNGNPFHLRFILQFLESSKTLHSSPIHEKSIPSAVAELYTSILLRQGDSVLNLVRYAAALSLLGETDIIDCEILRIAIQKPCADEVLQAQALGLLDFFPARSYVRFSLSELQIAAYATIADAPGLHFSVGRSLWNDAFLLHDQKNKIDDEIKHKLLLAILHMRNSLGLISDFDERINMSQLCYEYGLNLSLTGDFATSAKLFEFAIFVLGSDIWRPDLYETSLVLHNAAVQTYLYIGDDDQLERTLDAIFNNARCFDDKLSAYITSVYALGKHQMKDGFRVASFVSSELGQPIDPNPGTLAIIKNKLKLRWTLLGKSDDFLTNLPEASESNLIIAHFLSVAMFFILIIRPEASPSAVAFSLYGYALTGCGRLEDGYRFGRLALKFAHRFEVWRPRIYFYTYGFTMMWTHPFCDSLEPLRQGQRDAIKYGDLLIYGTCAAFSIFVSLMMSTPLRSLEVDARSFCESLAEVEQLNPLIFLLPTWSVINELTGSTESLKNGAVRDTDTVIKYAIKEGVTFLLGYCYTDHAMLYYLLGDFQKTLEMTKKAFEYRRRICFKLTFYEGLASLALAWTEKSQQRRNRINHGRELAKLMRNWADRCPENFRNKQLLLDAELAALNEKSVLAIALYKESVVLAKHEGFLHEEGISHERLGHYQFYLGNVFGAKKSFQSARQAFDAWEAKTVVDRIDKLLASLNSKPEDVITTQATIAR